MPIRAILTDIEGTTSSIHFVHQVLFPYSAQALPAFLQANHAESAVHSALKQVAQDSQAQINDLSALTSVLLDWIKVDRKHGALKTLQGLIWQRGYQTVAFKAHVYPEVPAVLRAWQQQGLLNYVYSSGSIAAQKLLFAHTEAGDLSTCFSGYFDTTSGNKREPTSYQNIARAIGLVPGEIHFLSDIVEELDAARIAGMRTTQLVREPCPAQERHPIATDFLGITL